MNETEELDLILEKIATFLQHNISLAIGARELSLSIFQNKNSLNMDGNIISFKEKIYSYVEDIMNNYSFFLNEGIQILKGQMVLPVPNEIINENDKKYLSPRKRINLTTDQNVRKKIKIFFNYFDYKENEKSQDEIITKIMIFIWGEELTGYINNKEKS